MFGTSIRASSSAPFIIISLIIQPRLAYLGAGLRRAPPAYERAPGRDASHAATSGPLPDGVLVRLRKGLGQNSISVDISVDKKKGGSL